MSSKFALLRVAGLAACLSSLAGCALQPGNQTYPVVGTLPGYGDVLGGNSVYRLDMPVPAGRGEATPVVTLQYTSQGADGELGVGWFLAMAGNVTRCAKTLQADGYASGVHMDADDHLCMNGERMALVSGKYGKSGSVYHTQIESNDEIELHGDMQQPDSYLVIVYHDGKRDVFKQAVVLPGQTAPVAWYQSLHETIPGDTWEFHYDTSHPGEVLVSEVTYNGRDNNGTYTPGARSIHFEYEDRPDVSVHYYGGGEIRVMRRLKTVTVNMPASLAGQSMLQLYRYSLSYEQSLTTGRSLLRSVTECGLDTGKGTTQCLPPTVFTWQNPPLSFDKPVKYPVPVQDAHLTAMQMTDAAETVRVPYMLTGDFDGDGRRELFYYRPGVGAHLYFLAADGSVRKDVDVTDYFQTRTNPRFQFYAADVDDDGAMDLPGNVDGKLAFRSWTGADLGKPQLTAIPYNTGMSLIDLDGDGEADVVQPEPVKPGAQDYALYLYRNLDSKPGHLAFGPRQQLAPLADGHEHVQAVSGFSGELPTVLVSSDTRMEQVILLHQSADRTLHAQVATPESLGMPNRGFRLPTYFADINGDGLYDMVYSESSGGKPATWHYVLNMGGRFHAPVDTGVTDERQPGVATTGVVVGDLDGSRDDQLLYPDSLVTSFCIGESHTAKGNYTTDDYDCSEQMQQADPWEDLGIYRYAALKFQAAADGTLKPVVNHDTGIIAQANLATTGDISGDGSIAVISPFSPWFANGHFKDAAGKYSDCPPDYGCGLQVSRLHGQQPEAKDRAADVLLKAVNGVGTVTSWDYYPLTSSRAGLYKVKAVGSEGRYLGPQRVLVDAPAMVVGSYSVSDGANGHVATHTLQYGDDVLDPADFHVPGFRWIADTSSATGKRQVTVYDRRFPTENATLSEWTEPSSAVDDMDAGKPGSADAETKAYTWECIGPAASEAGCKVKAGAPNYIVHEVHRLTHQFDQSRKLWVDGDDSFSYDDANNLLKSSAKTTDSAKVETVTQTFTYHTGGDNWMRRSVATRDTKDSTETLGGDKSAQAVVTKDTKETMDADSHTRLVRKTTETDKPTNKVESYTYVDDPSSAAVGQIATYTVSDVNKQDGTVEQLATGHMSYSPDGYYLILVKSNDKTIDSRQYDQNTGRATQGSKDGLDASYTYDAFGRIDTLTLTKAGRTISVAQHYELCGTDCPSGAIYKRVDIINGSSSEKVTWYNARNEPMNDPYK